MAGSFKTNQRFVGRRPDIRFFRNAGYILTDRISDILTFINFKSNQINQHGRLALVFSLPIPFGNEIKRFSHFMLLSGKPAEPGSDRRHGAWQAEGCRCPYPYCGCNANGVEYL
jgi:hypothetical protein